MDYDWLKDNWKSSKPMISREMMMKIWSGNFKKSFLECLQCDLLVLPPHEFFAIYFMSFSKRWNCTRRRGSCNFSFLKNSLVQISSQLNSKPYDNQYKSKQARRLETQIKFMIDWLIDWLIEITTAMFLLMYLTGFPSAVSTSFRLDESEGKAFTNTSLFTGYCTEWKGRKKPHPSIIRYMVLRYGDNSRNCDWMVQKSKVNS